MEKTKMANDEAYINLRKALDSFRDVVLAEYAFIGADGADKMITESDEERKVFSDLVVQTVNNFLRDNSNRHRGLWDAVEPGRAKALEDHARAIKDHASGMKTAVSQLCPPGFEEKDGLCVPISLP
jgi:hypothetical protein